jgi:FkbM family methyltransferase
MPKVIANNKDTAADVTYNSTLITLTGLQSEPVEYSMYQAHGWWLPDQDTHFAEMLTKHVNKGGGPVYQQKIRRISIDSCRRKNLALDIGANVGLWSKDLCAEFANVVAFEPVVEFGRCLSQNVPCSNLKLLDLALGDCNTMVDMIITAGNTGHTHVDMTSYGRGTVHMVTLDSLEFPEIDYIKIDCEGFENKILAGAAATIKRYRPIIVIEDKQHKDVGHADTTGALKTLQSWGARILHTVNNDHVMGW